MSTGQPASLAGTQRAYEVPGVSPDVRASSTDDHGSIDRSLARLVDFVEACDPTAARDEWDSFELAVLRHMDAEEMFLLPAYEREDAVEAKAIRDEHAEIRRALGEIGLSLELHVLRLEPILALKKRLARHVEREVESMYRWASADDHRVLARAMLRRMGRPMAADPDDRVVRTLVSLAAACRDGERGYRRAAADAKDAGYRQIFERRAEERAQFADALAKQLQRFGVSRDASGTLLGAVHREWLDASATLTQSRAKTILRECERGEVAASKLYAAALHAGLPPGAQELVQEQNDSLRRALDEIRALLEIEKH